MTVINIHNLMVDSQTIAMNGTTSVAVTFGNEFSSVPQVVLSCQAQVEVWVSDITTVGCTVHASANPNSSIHLHALGSK